MRTYVMLVCLSALAVLVACPLHAGGLQVNLAESSTSELAAIVSDPVFQRTEQSVVTNAIYELGKRGTEAIPALLDVVSYPKSANPITVNGQRLQSAVTFGGMGTYGRHSMNIRAFPAAEQLVKIGDASIEPVMRKLVTDGRYVQEACLGVLVEMMDRDDVTNRLQKDLAAATDPAIQEKLRAALKRLPDIRSTTRPNPPKPPAPPPSK